MSWTLDGGWQAARDRVRGFGCRRRARAVPDLAGSAWPVGAGQTAERRRTAPSASKLRASSPISPNETIRSRPIRDSGSIPIHAQELEFLTFSTGQRSCGLRGEVSRLGGRIDWYGAAGPESARPAEVPSLQFASAHSTMCELSTGPRPTVSNHAPAFSLPEGIGRPRGIASCDRLFLGHMTSAGGQDGHFAIRSSGTTLLGVS